ncbi:histidine kinase [Bizionia gelidisalsuginis]|uniref:Histidine kinase n=1 Tax=Bizionia gelidisalsuginis TaxID=291188 RepID=A0ABY3MBC6_9FLAO|nr:histidine kinase [Bizionia gelidisalsuginis]TYC14108.1 histidine kinase [Bizionia gelidisalsuginis]
MNTTKRFLLQVLFWLFIWIVLWAQQSWSISFFLENIYVFTAQIILIAIIVFYTSPKFLLTKKYLIFILLSLSSLLLLAYLSTFFIETKPPHPLHLEKPLRRPPFYLLPFTLFLLIAYSLATIIEVFMYAKKKEAEIVLSKNETLQTELKLLKSQINPHFLFNALNNIYALSVIDSNKTQESISYLSNMLRYVLYDCEQRFVLLKNEINYIEDYIKLFSLKSTKNFPITIHFEVNNPEIKIAPMLLIPFVENALKHSNIEKIKDTFISISIIETTDFIVCSIKNSIAKEAVIKDKIGGIGLDNVKKRLSILYPEQHKMKISENNFIFNVELKLKKNV